MRLCARTVAEAQAEADRERCTVVHPTRPVLIYPSCLCGCGGSTGGPCAWIAELPSGRFEAFASRECAQRYLRSIGTPEQIQGHHVRTDLPCREIRRRFLAGATVAELARIYGCARRSIQIRIPEEERRLRGARRRARAEALALLEEERSRAVRNPCEGSVW